MPSVECFQKPCIPSAGDAVVVGAGEHQVAHHRDHLHDDSVVVDHRNSWTRTGSGGPRGKLLHSSTTCSTSGDQSPHCDRNSNLRDLDNRTCTSTSRDEGAAANKWPWWKTLLLGQFCSLLVCGTNISSAELQQLGFDFPTLQSSANYVLLTLVFGIWYWGATLLSRQTTERPENYAVLPPPHGKFSRQRHSASATASSTAGAPFMGHEGAQEKRVESLCESLRDDMDIESHYFLEGHDQQLQASSRQPLLGAGVRRTRNDNDENAGRPLHDADGNDRGPRLRRRSDLEAPLPTTSKAIASACSWSLWLRRLVLAVVDVEANYFVVLAFKYTSPIMVSLICSTTAPWAMALGLLTGMKKSYTPWQCLAVVLCVAGLGLTVLAENWREEANSGSASGSGGGETTIRVDQTADTLGSVTVPSGNSAGAGGSETWKGNLLVLLASVLYACSNTLQEWFLSQPHTEDREENHAADDVEGQGDAQREGDENDHVDVENQDAAKRSRSKIARTHHHLQLYRTLFLLGALGSVITVIQFFALEYRSAELHQFFVDDSITDEQKNDESVEQEDSTTRPAGVAYLLRNFTRMQQVVILVAAFQLCLFGMYATCSTLLQNADAVLFNCSLLTSDVYVLAYHSWWCGEPVHWVFYIGFCITLAACGLYNVTEEAEESQNFSDSATGRTCGGGQEMKDKDKSVLEFEDEETTRKRIGSPPTTSELR